MAKVADIARLSAPVYHWIYAAFSDSPYICLHFSIQYSTVRDYHCYSFDFPQSSQKHCQSPWVRLAIDECEVMN